jgi:regulator of protease activity HflC (stomatin/prohibitin superfamily)
MEKLFKTLGWTAAAGFVMVAVLGFMAATGTGFAIVSDGSRGIMKTGTKYDMKAVAPGYHFFIPVYQTMDIKTIRPILINYSQSEGKNEDTELLNYEMPLKGVDKKGIPVGLALSIEVKPTAEKLPLMYREDGDFENSFYKKVLQVNREAVQSTISKFSVDTIMDHRAEVEKVLTTKIKEGYAENPYFTLVGINLKDILIPEEITKKMLEVQSAKQDALKSLELIKKAQNEAKAREAKAEGESNAVKIAAQGKADAILTEATAQAKANMLLSKSLTDKIIKIQTIEKWNGVKSMVSGQNQLILDLSKK